VSEIDELRLLQDMSKHVDSLLGLLNLPEDDHFKDTPMRFSKMLRSFTQYTEEDLANILKAGFEETQDNILVTQRRIPFAGLCAHHLLPFWGTAAIGYLPRKRVVGLSKLARLVGAAGRVSPSTQEHITNLIADALADTLEPIGVGVVTIAAHGCMAVRGVNAPQTVTQVNALRGQMLLNPQARQEFMRATKGK
jgi:GTP cyclohydrolase I